MNLMIARRTRAYIDPEKWVNYVPNPEWINAPLELVDLGGPTVGPYRFRANDQAQAEQYALMRDLDALGRLAIPELIPPTT